MQISRGIVNAPLKIALYGTEGIGKSTFAAQAPGAIFCDTEGGTKRLDVARTPAPTSYQMIRSQIDYFIQHPAEIGTFVLDTADWAERMIIEQLCTQYKKRGLEDWDYGKGYIHVCEEFGRLLNALTDLCDKGVNIIVNCHATVRKFELPDQNGQFDRWQMKLGRKSDKADTSAMLREWADMVLFANYKTNVVNVDGKGTQKGSNKASGGKRVMYTTHAPCWDAKNRFGLADELPFEFSQIAHLFQPHDASPAPAPAPAPAPHPAAVSRPEPPTAHIEPSMIEEEDESVAPKALRDLMHADNVELWEIKYAVTGKGYYPADTPFRNYDMNFVSGVLIGAWPQVLKMILANREEIPFLNEKKEDE